jgi:two-component system cell cycle response regulator CpdR
MIGFDVTRVQTGEPNAFGITIPGKALLSMGQNTDARVLIVPRTRPRPIREERGVHPKFTRHPAYGGRENKGGGSHSSPRSAGSTMAKIILAEDDNDMRRFLVKALQNAGYDVISFDNGLSAYQRLREEPFELLLTDIVMPEMDGIELARRASELDPDIKIMFITGFAAVALNSDSAAPKNAKVLSKPVHLRELVNEVQKMLAA